ncbi:MAG: tyrosine--tRNA ligase [Candidatus Chisholmbacteria bacterium RIFCSPLOWO2_01_FULL_50_28]|uniref:Tyrosine--tRNA ligase n=1 Tax=Candidatus Chisholmbacteria bacterium RIFCSPHIGHO2_01_FULL_52_32 TaxID=1797591 RepID=A0A1G1VSG7_9BACT|nr:MAG: tyrosine--tRNA ligase [Candidatus Chisholmbacteria bacterium RIFCSPHIGHO2_01_FULL_52_32]OGY20290.1 MAG: tyrosine--tRNA ligase [Candidatus Chisholmbacteria bacterium RIFCSPLOWO2_01_FULL_50_28]
MDQSSKGSIPNLLFTQKMYNFNEMTIGNTKDAIDSLLSRRVDKILPSKEGLKQLITTRKIRLYQGFDPTGAKLHLGHTIGLRKLMEFASLGHEVIFLFGTGTVLVGDPSQRESGRKVLKGEEIESNIRTWKKQVEPIVDFTKVTIRKNADWLTNLSLKEIITVASHISAIQLFKRDMFKRRLDQGDTVWYHETMYPLLQGYDSVVMDVDLEIGGTDQEFNMLIGRELQAKINHREKYILTVPMIMGTDGKMMSKTSKNCIWLSDSAEDMYGKIMSLPDSQILPYLELVTDIPLVEIRSLPNDPLANKKRLAFEVTRTFHGQSKASQIKEAFERVVQRGLPPEELKDFSMENISENDTITDILTKAKLAETRSEAKRLISQGGVAINGKRINTPLEKPQLQPGSVIRAGKRKFIRLTK